MATQAATKIAKNEAIEEVAKTTKRGQSDGVEQWLDRFGVRYTLIEVPIGVIDENASLSNQARLATAINEGTVETYAEAMGRGDKFPAMVAYERGGSLILVDGNHRLLAHKTYGDEHVPVYLLDSGTRADLLVKLTFEANTRHGLPNSLEDRIAHAVYLVENAGMSQKDAAAAVNIPLPKLASAWLKQKAERRARNLGVANKSWSALPATTKTKLNALANDDVFAKVLDVAVRAGLRHEEVRDFVTELNKETSSRAQMSKADDFELMNRDRIQAHAGKSSKVLTGRAAINSSGHLRRILMGMGQILNADIDEARASIHDAQKDDVLSRVQRSIDKLVEVRDSLTEG